MVQDLILNAALLVTLATFHNLLARIRMKGKISANLVSGLLFGGVAIIGMNMPFHYAQGVIYDGRSIVMVMAGLFGGGTTSLVAMGIAGAYRAYLGGNGIWGGVATIVSTAFVGLAFRRLVGNRPGRLSIPALFGIGIVAHIAMLACQLLVIPWPTGLTILGRVWMPVMLVFPAATMLMGILLREEEQRITTEAALLESEDKFRVVFEDANVGKSLTQIDGEMHINQAFCEMLGFSMGELQGIKWQEITHPDDLGSNQREVDDLLAGKKDRARFTKRYVRKDGSPLWADVSTSVRRDIQGKLLYLMTTVVDISEQKRVEEALLESHALLNSVGRMAKVGGWEVDAATRAVSWTEQTHRIHEIPLDYMPSLEEAINFFHPEDRNKFSQAIERALAYGEPYDLELGFITAKGNHLWTRTLCVPQVIEGDTVKLVGTFQDITEQRQNEDKIRKLNAELEQRVEARTQELREAQEQLVRQERLAVLGQLAGGVGHELRNPLGIISNAIYYLRLVLQDADEDVNEYLGMIEIETHNANKIISDLLDFSRIKSVDPQAIFVLDIVKNVLTRFSIPEFISVTVELPPSLPQVFADPLHIEQVLGNLVNNACQAMPHGGQLTISATQKGEQVAISIKDTGVGISPENTEKIFEPLFTTKPKGIGLGLAVSRKLAEANLGQVEVHSQPGNGSTFTLTLPIHKEYNPVT